MGRNLEWLLRRLVQYSVSLLLLASLCFLLLKFFPGSPFEENFPIHSQVRQALEKKFALDQSLPRQYLSFLKNLLQFDLGPSMVSPAQSVSELMLPKLGITLKLAFLSLLLSVVFGFAIALFFVWYQQQVVYEVFTLSLLSIPVLTLAPVLIWLFGFYWDLLPVARLDHISSWILPLAVLAARPSIQLARLLRLKWLEALDQPFIRTARAFGASANRIRLKWSLKNALIPFVAYLGVITTSLVSGSLLVETLFAIPGISSQFVEAILNRDYPLIIGFTIFSGTVMITTQFLVEVCLRVLDPRIEERR
jgi:oligopeptide transport system permease protein